MPLSLVLSLVLMSTAPTPDTPLITASGKTPDTPLITASGKTTFALCVEVNCKPEGRLPVTLREGLTVDDVSVAVDTVSLNGVLDGSLRDDDAFTVAWQTDGPSKRPIAIVISVPVTKVQRQGSYDVVIAVSVKKTSERLVVIATATRAPGALTVPAVLKFDRTIGFPFFSSAADKARLVATETSKSTAVVVEGRSTGSDDSGRSGVVRLTANDARIERGDHGNIPYETVGAFPLGVTSGTLVLSSEQLIAPLLAAYEVRTRLHPIYILFVAGGGLSVSWFVKGKLQGDIARATAEVRANELLTHIAAARARHLDPSLDRSVKEQMGALMDALLQKRTAQEIEDARVALATAFQAALDALPAKRVPVEKRIEDLRVVTDTPWAVPTEIVQQLQEARVGLRPALAFLQSDGIEQADAAAEEVRKTLMGHLSTSVGNWRDDISLALADLQKPMPGLSDQVIAATAAALSTATAAVTPITFSDPTAGPDAVLPVLRTLVRSRQLVGGAMRAVGLALQDEVAAGATRLTSVPLPVPDALAAVQSAAQSASSFLEELADAPSLWVTRPKVLQALHDAWGRALTSEAPDLAVQLKVLNDDREYLDEVELVANALSSAGFATATAGLTSRQLFAPMFFSAQFPFTDGAAAVVQVALPSADRIPTARPIQFLTQKDIDKARRWQAIIIGVLLMAAGYSLYEPAFIGTPNDVINVFVWAFGLDVTVDAVLKLVKKP